MTASDFLANESVERSDDAYIASSYRCVTIRNVDGRSIYSAQRRGVYEKGPYVWKVYATYGKFVRGFGSTVWFQKWIDRNPTWTVLGY